MTGQPVSEKTAPRAELETCGDVAAAAARRGRDEHQWALPDMGSRHCISENDGAASSHPAKNR